MRYFEYKDNKSGKFWQVEQHGSDLNIGWGKVGADGQSQTKSFADEAKAAGAMEKLIKEKTRKGYQEVNAEGGQAEQTASRQATKQSSSGSVSLPPENTPPTQPAVSCTDLLQKLESAQKSEPETPPWLKNGEPLDFDEKFLAKAFPGRQFPGKPEKLNAAKSWKLLKAFLNDLTPFVNTDNSEEKESIYPWIASALQRLLDDDIRGSFESNVALFLMTFTGLDRLKSDKDKKAAVVTDYLVAQYGLEYAVDVLIRAEQCEIREKRTDWGRQFLFYKNVGKGDILNKNLCSLFSPQELRFRTYLAQAEEALWTMCADKLQASLPLFVSKRRLLVAFLLPERPEIAREILPDIMYGNRDTGQWLRLVLTDADDIKRLESICHNNFTLFQHDAVLPTLIRDRGAEAANVLIYHASLDQVAAVLTHIGTPEAVSTLFYFSDKSKKHAKLFENVLQRWPAAAMYALSEIGFSPLNAVVEAGLKHAYIMSSGKKDKLRAKADSSLIKLFTGPEAGWIQEVFPWLSEAAKQHVLNLLKQCEEPEDVAQTEDLPSILVSPPWLEKSAASELAAEPLVLSLETLSLEPVERWDEADKSDYLSAAEQRKPTLTGNAKKDAQRIADGLGFGIQKTDAVLSETLRQRAVDAIYHRKTEALLEAIDAYQKAFHVGFLEFSAVDCLPQEMALEIWNTYTGNNYSGDFFAAKYGLKALPGLKHLFRQDFSHEFHLAMAFGDVELAALAIKHFFKSKTLRTMMTSWLLKFPQFATAAAIPAMFSRKAKERSNALTILRLLAENQHLDTVFAVAEGYKNQQVIDELRRELSDDPLWGFPDKIEPMPAFWNPLLWRRPVLISNGKTLPENALHHLGTMLTFPAEKALYPGITQVKSCCTPQSLADFAWDCFSAWREASAPMQHSWAFHMLGWFGNDDTARRLTPLIRQWPGESQHQKAVMGLDILRAIGSDVALMMLNGIALKVKFKGLQEQARQMIARVADSRSLSVDELEDRLVPDVGLDEQTSLLLDYGSRQFRIGFDEQLQPCIFDKDGIRLKALPKPNKNDDALLAKQAAERFNQLKKDVKTLASQQIFRLENAMCQKRVWAASEFFSLLVSHPLLKHIVQRLVWGVYRLDEISGVTRFVDAFRVAEDGTLTTAQDDEFTLPAGDNLRIGVPHALELPREEAAAFSQLFADYALLQPFVQLGREIYSLTDEERSANALTRWKGNTVETGKILGLTHKGWLRGEVQDGGTIWCFIKPVNQRQHVQLLLSPGMTIGALNDNPQQELGDVVICDAWQHYAQQKKAGYTFSTLEDIAVSELIRDLETLCHG